MSAYTGDIVKDGLVLALDAANSKSYPGSGTVWNDLSGNSITGSLVNGPTYSSTNRGSVVFDGTNDVVNINNPASFRNQNFTVALWLNPLAQNAAIISISDFDHASAPAQGWVLQSEDATTNRYYYLGWHDGSQFQPVGGFGAGLGIQVTTSAWQHLVYTKSGTSLLGYLNGTLVYNRTGTSATVNYQSNRNFQISNCIGASTRAFKGNISQLNIYNRALSAAEIRENYNATKGRYDTTRSSDAIKPRLSTSGLVLHLDAANYRSFVSGSTTWRDLSGNGFNGTLTNGPTFSTENGGELVFDGSNDYVTVPSLTDFATSNQFTAIIWAKSAFSTWNEYGFLISRRNQFIIHPDLNTRNVSFYIHSPIGGSGGFYNVGWTPSDITVYNQYCMTYNAGTLAAYGNGILRQSSAVGATLSSDTGKTEIGKDEDLNRYLNGRIGLVQIYNRALSASEILQNYNLAKGRFGYVR